MCEFHFSRVVSTFSRFLVLLHADIHTFQVFGRRLANLNSHLSVADVGLD